MHRGNERVGFFSENLQFDTFGYISSTLDTIYINSYTRHEISYYGGHILFPPATKNTVLGKLNSDQINIFINSHSIILQSPSPLGAITASLYSVDGRLLKRTKLWYSAAGEYIIDASDVHTHFALLVLQTERGVITRKILF